VRTAALAAACVAVAGLGAGPAAASGEPVTVLPKPRFGPPASAPARPSVRFVVVSSAPLDPGRPMSPLRPPGLRLEGPAGASRHVVVAPGRYAFDFENHAHPPRFVRADRDLVYEQVVWARESGGLLLVETAHSTYARSSYGRNAYLSAVDARTGRLRWRSAALVANADDFVLLDGLVVSGYGFTAEPDYLYAVDLGDGRVRGRLLLPSAPERIARHGRLLTVDTYDHRLVVRVVPA